MMSDGNFEGELTLFDLVARDPFILAAHILLESHGAENKADFINNKLTAQ